MNSSGGLGLAGKMRYIALCGSLSRNSVFPHLCAKSL